MNKDKIKSPWWREGIIVFVKVSSYIVIPIVIASFLGKYLDTKYNTGNLIFLITITLAFISTIFLIAREMKIYNKKVEKDNN